MTATLSVVNVAVDAVPPAAWCDRMSSSVRWGSCGVQCLYA
jgi:hypothetical protein